MKKIKLDKKGEIVLQTTLTQGQVSKFNKLIQRLIVEDGAAYIPINELHGVLLTNSRDRAKTIVNNHQDIVKNFLVRDRIRFQKYNVSAAIKPVGLYLLLETLAQTNPKRANDYRASLALLSYIIASYPQLSFSSQQKAKYKNAEKSSVVGRLKRNHQKCQLSGQYFTDEDEKHVHHIEGASEDPALATDENNLIVIKGIIHEHYHTWLIRSQKSITRNTLRMYAKQNGYSLKTLEA
ncbi:hypothetical protein [Spirulina sp. 06S082]|uniref:hypothetical protein n=1 Tax=Spirulina sp. 06S082 TaxID=3110248 RepID=UPI002B21D3AD|nr:hypothetical protein [Spirulina sp. 06S082]MEA5467504.1 hypothetical protein [Spirulina sp. 06S082]